MILEWINYLTIIINLRKSKPKTNSKRMNKTNSNRWRLRKRKRERIVWYFKNWWLALDVEIFTIITRHTRFCSFEIKQKKKFSSQFPLSISFSLSLSLHLEPKTDTISFDWMRKRQKKRLLIYSHYSFVSGN